VALKRLLPATVNLNGKRIDVQPDNLTGSNNRNYGGAGRGITADDLKILRTKLVTAIKRTIVL